MKIKLNFLLMITAALAVFVTLFSFVNSNVTAAGDFTIVNNVLTKYNGAGGAVVVPSGVTKIGDHAFEDTAVTNITLPSTVTEVGFMSFAYCDDLTTAQMPNVKIIGDVAFMGSHIESIYMPNIQTIGNAAFQYTYFKSLTLPEGLKTIKPQAFSLCENLTTVHLPSTITTLERFAFDTCEKMSTVTMADGITGIQSFAFYKCSSLTTVALPGSVQYIPRKIFYECFNLTTVTLLEGIIGIDEEAFSGCSNLTTAYLPESLQYIYDLAFIDTKLTNIVIPENVTEIGPDAFKDTPWLENYPEDFVIVGDHILIAYKGTDTQIIVPDTVKSNIKKVFENLTNVTDVMLPSGITELDGTFSGCVSLQNVNIPSGVSFIGNETFGNCKALKKIVLPDSVLIISDTAFAGCDDIKIYGSDYSNIADYALSRDIPFGDLSTINIQTLPNKAAYLQGEDLDLDGAMLALHFNDGYDFSINITENMVSGYNPEIIGSQSLTVRYDNQTVDFEVEVRSLFSIRDGLLTEYNGPGGEVEIPDGVTEIAANVFKDKNDLTDIVFPESVTAIGSGAFEGCVNLKTAIIGESVQFIEPDAFKDCNLLYIYCPPGSATQAFAAEHSIPYINSSNKISSINVLSMPDKLAYTAGDALDVTGGKLNAVFTDNSTQSITLTPAMISVYNANTVGSQTISVYYGGKYASFDITVFPKIGDPIVSAFVDDGKAFLQWIAVDGASKYQIFVYDSASGRYTSIAETDQTNFTVNNLINNREYVYCVTAFNGAAYTKPAISKHVKVKPIPAPVLNSIAKDGQVELNWNAVSEATKYKVFSYDPVTLISTEILEVTDSKTLIEGLTNGVSYTYFIRSRNNVSISVDSNHVTVSPKKPIDAPVAAATAADKKITLTWNSVKGAVSYQISSYNANAKTYIVLKTLTDTTYTISGLTNGIAYTYLIRAFDGTDYSNYSESDHVSAKPIAAPIVTATAGDKKIILKWNTIPGAISYKIFSYDSKLKTYKTLSVVTSTTYTQSNLTNGTAYIYLVRAYNGMSWSAYTTAYHVTAKPISVPIATATAGDKKVTLKWNSVTGATSYNISLYDSKTKSYKSIANTTSTTYSHSSLTNGKLYTYLVRAYNGMSWSAYTTANHVSAKPISAPIATATAGDKKVTLKWNSVTGATLYNISLYDSKSKSYKSIANTTSTTYSQNNLTNGTLYTYLIRAYNGFSWSAYTTANHVSAKPIAAPKVTVSVGDGMAYLKWSAVSGATLYRIYAYNSVSKAYTAIADTKSTNYTKTSLKNGQIYIYMVKAYNGVNWNQYTSYNHVIAKPIATPIVTATVKDNAVTLKWNTITGSNSYKIYSYNPTTKVYTKIATATSTSYTKSGLTRGKTYYYLVLADNGLFTSSYTAADNVIVKIP